MRKKKQQEMPVRTITTGHVEADMLGQVYLWVSERQNRLKAQRSHRNKLKGYSFLSRSEVAKMIKSRKQNISERYIRGVFKWLLTAPTACLRSLKAWQDKKDAGVPKYLHGLRKDKRND